MKLVRANEKVTFAYLAFILIALFMFFMIDEMAFARFAGYSTAHFFDPAFSIPLMLGFYIAFKFDALIAAFFSSLVCALVSFSAIRDWHQKIGINDSAFDIIFSKTISSFFPSFITYSLVVTIFILAKKK